jgi:hypothetical protein
MYIIRAVIYSVKEASTLVYKFRNYARHYVPFLFIITIQLLSVLYSLTDNSDQPFDCFPRYSCDSTIC